METPYRLVIKVSSGSAAKQVAKQHGIELQKIVLSDDQREVYADAECSIIDLQNWFNEDLDKEAPYPQGSLLHFSPLKKEES